MPPTPISKKPQPTARFPAMRTRLVLCVGLIVGLAGGAGATEPAAPGWIPDSHTDLSQPSAPPFEIDGLQLEFSSIDPSPIALRRAPASLSTGPTPATADPSDRSRPRGIAFIDLPGRLRARFDATYTTNLYSSDDLAEPFLSTSGPELRDAHSLESRVSLSRPVGRFVELEIAWGGRSRIERVDLLDFDRQTVGAMIRIAP